MALVSEQVPNILGGVSQAPQQQRDASQGEIQTNWLDSIQHGKSKRPPSKHLALLDSSTTGYDTAFVHEINRSSTEKYTIIVANGTIKVFDIDGNPVQVQFPDGTGYLGLDLDEAQTAADSFSGTPGDTLGTHKSDSGPLWSLLQGNIPDNSGRVCVDTALIENGFLVFGNDSANSNKWSGYLYDISPDDADYAVQVTVTPTTAVETNDLLLGLRVVDAAGVNVDGYFLRLPDIPWATGSSWTIEKWTSGGATNLASFTNPIGSWPATTPHIITFGIVGDVLTAYVDGAVVGTATDSTYTASGNAALIGRDQGTPSTPQLKIAGWQMNYTTVNNTPQGGGFRAVTVEDFTFLVNTTKTVKQSLVKSAKQGNGALIAVSQADFGTNYTIVIDQTTIGFSTGDAVSPDARPQLSTDSMAQQITALINQTAPLSSLFTATQYGSTVYLVKKDGTPFTLTVSDGLSDQGILAIQGSVQTFSQLPARAINGYLVQITGDPSNAFDNYWVQYNDEGNPQQDGVWLETVAPGVLTTLDPTTMPHQLVRLGSVLFGHNASGPLLPPIIGTGNPTSNNYGVDGQGSVARPVIGDHTHFDTITPTLDGNTHELIFAYDVSAALLPPGETLQVQINQDVSGTITTLGSKTYGGGVSVSNETQSYSTSLANGAAFQIELLYSRAATPPENHQASITVHAQVDPSGLPGLEVTVTKAITYTFPLTTNVPGAVAMYPQGMTIEVGTSIHHVSTTLTADKTPIQLATLLAGLNYSGTGFNASNPSDGVLWLTTTGTPPPAAGIAVITFSTATTFYNPDLDLTPGSLVGNIIQDTSDGSSGTIIANTSTTITVAALTGGVDNAFGTNDVCNVVGSSADYFLFQKADWTTRQVGDDNTNPFPSFTNQELSEVFFIQDRLGFTSLTNVVMSGADDLYNFFRTTVTDLLDGDMIDVQSASQQVSNFSSAVHWQEGTYLFADEGQTALVGDPILTPKTVSLQPSTYYPCAPIRALAMDRRIYFTRSRTNVTQIFRLQRATFPQIGLDAEEITKPTPTYLPGNPVQIVGDPTLEMLFVITDGAPNTIFVYNYHYDAANLTQESISQWVLGGDTSETTILNMGLLDGVLYIVVLRFDGLYLETIDTQIGLYDHI